MLLDTYTPLHGFGSVKVFASVHVYEGGASRKFTCHRTSLRKKDFFSHKHKHGTQKTQRIRILWA